MVNKFLLTLAVVLAISALGNGLTCYKCRYNSNMPREQQTCGSETVSCSTGYCFTAIYTEKNGVVDVVRDCDPGDYCPKAEETCKRLTKVNKLKSCAGACCKTDKCNNYTPSSATGIMAAKFTLCVMFIGAFLFA